MNLRNASALAGLIALAAAGCSPKAPAEEVVATINGETIPMKEYYSRLERKTRVTVNGPQGPQPASIVGTVGSQMIQDLINERILLQLAKEDNAIPTEADIKAEIDQQEKDNPKFVSTLASQGVSLEEIKHQIKMALVQERLISKGIVVTAPQVDEYIKSNPTRFTDPEKASMLWIALNDATKKALVDKDLKSGQDFRTVALRYTEPAAARQNGAVFPNEIVDQLPPELQGPVRKTPENKATDWIFVQNTWVKFYVQKKTPAKKQEITPEVKKRVQRELAAQRGQMANDVQKRMMDKLKNSKIDVAPKNLKEPWDKQFAEIKNQIAQQEAASRNAPGGMPGGAPGTAPGAAPGGAPIAPPSGSPSPATTGQ